MTLALVKERSNSRFRADRFENTVVHVIGIALVIVAIGMFLSAMVGWIDGGPDRSSDTGSLVASGAIGVVAGGLLWWLSAVPVRQSPVVAFASVAWSWLAVSILGALPFLFSGAIEWAHADNAIFESISGFTCTGSTILADIEAVPRGVLFFRSMTQWFGGMGLIVLAVAILPALKVGGLELIAAEAPGPTTDRLDSNVTETARRLWILYGSVTVVVTVLLMLFAGASLYDGVAHAFATASTGGFSPYGASVGHFDSVAFEVIISLGMLYCGASFALHWRAVQGDWGIYGRVSEFRLYVAMFFVLVGLIMWVNVSEPFGLATNLRHTSFSVAAILSSTGFGTADFALWGPAAQAALLLVFMSAGMSGSTSGGMKVLRLQIIAKYAAREVVRARHPRAIVPLRLGSTVVPDVVVSRVIGFVLLYVTFSVVGGLLLAALGTDGVTAFSAAFSATGNIGPALGEAGPASNFLVIPRAGRPILMWLMLFGRLEVFPTLLMFAAAARHISKRRVAGYASVTDRR